jgi:hypothetical protein
MKSDFEELQKIPGQLRCGGPRGLGKFYGTDWPRRFCELALSNGASIDLVEVLDNFDADFKKLADIIDCSSSEIISRLVLGAAVIGSHLPHELTDQLKIEVMRLKNSEAGKASGEKRREAPSSNPITEFIEKKLNRDRDISSADMVDALEAEAQNTGGSRCRTMARLLLLWTTEK